MKKFLSLILALLMLVSISVPALADIDDPYDLVMADSSIDNLGDDGQMLHGYTYYYKLTNGDETIKIDKRDFKIEYELAKGSDKYVADYGLKDGKFFITVVSSSDATPDDPGYIDFKFSVTAKSDWEKRDIAKGDEFFATEGFDVYNDLYYVDTYPDVEDAEVFDGSGANVSFSSYDRGWVIFDCGPIDILMRLSSSRIVSFDPEVIKNDAISKLAKETTPKIVTFHAQPTIGGTATLMVDSDYDYVYSFDGTNLTQIKVTEDGLQNKWKMTDGTLGTYVLSKEALTAAPAPAPESSAAPAPAPEAPAEPAPAPESSVTEPVEEPEEPVEEPADEPVDITPEPEEPEEPVMEPEEEPVPEVEPEETKPMLPMVLLILVAAIVAAVLIALLVARSGKKSRR